MTWLRYTAFLLLACACQAFAETAIIPYKIINPSKYFTEAKGPEYARILYLTAMVKKNEPLASPESIEVDIQKLGLEPVITDEELLLLGRTRQLDYVLAGSLAKVRGSFVSRNRLVAVRDGRVILEFENRASDLFSLALEDVKDAFSSSKNTSLHAADKKADIAVLIDMSYPVKPELESIKDGLHAFFRGLDDSGGLDSRIYVIPFSDSVSSDRATVSETPYAFRQSLDNLKPRGSTSSEDLSRALRYALKNLQWRRGAKKIIITVLNNDIKRSIGLENHGFTANKMGIPVYALFCSRVTRTGSQAMEQITDMTEGKSLHVAYCRSFIDSAGQKGFLFLERGRLFFSPLYSSSWKQGILQEDPDNPAFLSVDPKYEEITDPDSREHLGEGSMAALYQKATGNIVLKSNDTENNIPAVFETLLEKYTGSFTSDDKVIARMLLSDGNVSFWAGISDRGMLEYFSGKERQKHYCNLGVLITENEKENYGLNIVPLLTGISPGDVPDTARADLAAIVKNRKKYLSSGVARLPLWFISVKVELIEYSRERRDMRE